MNQKRLGKKLFENKNKFFLVVAILGIFLIGYSVFIIAGTTLTLQMTKSVQKISDTNGSFTETLANNDNFGYAVTSIGDLNNDSIIDLVVSAPYDGGGGLSTGAVYVLFMHTNGSVNTSQKISNITGNFNASQSLNTFDYFGIFNKFNRGS